MLKAGIYKKKITPNPNLVGSYRLHWNKKPKGVHDDLFATTLYLNDNSNKLLLISLDTLSLTNDIATNIRAKVAQKANIPICGIMIACTHTHNSLDSLDEDYIRDNKIFEDLTSKVIACAQKAIEVAEDAKIGFGDTCLALGKNRLAANWSEESISIGAIDPVCDIIKIENTTGKVLGIFFHYSAHPTSAMGCEYMISRDCIGYAVDILEKNFNCLAGFFQGAAGNINFQIGKRSYKHAKNIGNTIAEFIGRTLPGIDCSSNITVASQERVLKLKKRTDYDFDIVNLNKDIATAEQKLKALAKQENADSKTIYTEFNALKVLFWKKILYDSNQVDSCIEALVQAIRIGDVDIIAAPGELFVEYQLAFRAEDFPRRGMIFGYANGYIGYIPTSDALKLGGYGTDPSFIQQVYPDAGQKMLETGIEMLKKI